MLFLCPTPQISYTAVFRHMIVSAKIDILLLFICIITCQLQVLYKTVLMEMITWNKEVNKIYK